LTLSQLQPTLRHRISIKTGDLLAMPLRPAARLACATCCCPSMLRRNHSLRSGEIAWCTRLLRGDHLPNDRSRALKELRAADRALLLSQGALCLSSLMYTLPESSQQESPEYAMVGAMMLLLGLCGVVGVLRGSCALLQMTHMFCAMTALFAGVMLLALPSVRDHCARMVTRQRTCLRCTALEVRACPMLTTHRGLVLAQQRRSNGQRHPRLLLAATGGHLGFDELSSPLAVLVVLAFVSPIIT